MTWIFFVQLQNLHAIFIGCYLYNLQRFVWNKICRIIKQVTRKNNFQNTITCKIWKLCNGMRLFTKNSKNNNFQKQDKLKIKLKIKICKSLIHNDNFLDIS